ncbi:MAG: DNA polymerase IV, partial [Spirochaetes bacterium]|nr:DNA polymerase IV [Spirochaetota bacterium]
LVEQISIDEAFLNCSGTEALTGPENILAMSIKERIRQETTLTASVGVASNKSIAKIASELCKPDGLLVCPSGEEGKFIENLSLKCLWGAGEKTVESLNSLGYTTIGDVAKSSRAVLEKIFGKHGLKLWRLANGIDERPVKNESSRKSIGEEITFSRDVESDSYIEHVLFRISDRLTRKMRILGLKGRTVSIKIRLQGFETFTRSRTLDFPVNDMKTIRSMSLELFRHFDRKDKKIRLVGISVSNFGVKPAHLHEQFELFREGRKEDSMNEEKIAGQSGTDPDALLDKMKKLYGEKVTRAAFLPNLYEKERGWGGD